ncbi:MAG: inorganic phosphate transporter [Candidatus Hodarchaeaceae archaeon]|nr:inorganic phosphate transporter [Candidatus Hodarchaeaceae archaeon]
MAVLGVAFFMGWGMGANDAANSMATSVGARILTLRRAMLLLAIFAIAGAVLQGGYVMHTVGEKIVFFENENAAENIALAENISLPAGAKPTPFTLVPIAALGAILAAAIWVIVATRLGLPVSTSHSIVGAVMGAGFALMFIGPPALAGAGVQIGYSKFVQIAFSWIITPIGAIAFAYLIYHASNRPLRRVKNIALLNTIYSTLVIITASFMAYSFGANDVGNAAGVVVAACPGADKQLLGLFGGVAIACGAILYSQRVIDTIGKRITVLAPATAFAAQFGAALTVYIFTMLAIPVSTSHAAVGGVIGAGLVRGTSAVSGRRVRWISLAWVFTPLITMAISFGLAMLLTGV